MEKFKYLDEWIERRRKIADVYNNELNNCNLTLPKEHPDNKHAYYIYVVAHERRDNIMSELAKKDIHLNISYPWPIHIMDAYKHFVCSTCNCLKKTEDMAKKIFSLPMYVELEDEQVNYICDCIKKL